MEMDNVDKWSLQVFGIFWTYKIKFVNASDQVIDERHNVPNDTNEYQLSDQVEIHNRHASEHLRNIHQNDTNVRVNVER